MRRNRLSLALVVVGVVVVISRLLACGEASDELAELDMLLAELDAECSEGACSNDEGEVPTRYVLARAIESREASRFGDEGLYVLSTWEIDDRWIELELDLPTNRSGFVDLDIRYDEFVEGEPAFRAADLRGRIVLVEPDDGGLPYAAHLELRLESEEREVRRIHQGYLDPDDVEGLNDPGPPDREIDWERPEVELVVFRAEGSSSSYSPPSRDSSYEYDYRTEDEVLDVVIESCAASAETEGCSGDDPDDDWTYTGESTYYDDTSSSGGCSGDSSWCSGDDTSTYDDTSSGGCSGDDSEDSFCQGDSTDDVWDDDSDVSGCDCSGDTTYDDGTSSSGSFCEGDDYSGDSGCDGGDTSSSSSGDCFDCEGDTWVGSRASKHRRELLARARGRASRPVRRAVGFLPILFAFALTRVMRGRRG